MAMLGKAVRMRRLVNEKSDKLLAITIDHSISRGILNGLIPVQQTLDKIVAAEPDAITMTKGIAELCFPRHAGKVSLLLKCSNYAPVHPTHDVAFGDVDEALRMGADGCSIGAMMFGTHQGEQVREIGRFSKDCMAVGMPLVGHIYPKGESVAKADQTDWKNIAYCCRAGAELGVDIIKTTYTGDPATMEKVVAACPARVVIQGGDACNTIEDYLKMTRDALDAGVGGVTFGRFVWEYPHITELVLVLKHMIHDNASLRQALQMLKDLENQSADKP